MGGRGQASAWKATGLHFWVIVKQWRTKILKRREAIRPRHGGYTSWILPTETSRQESCKFEAHLGSLAIFFVKMGLKNAGDIWNWVIEPLSSLCQTLHDIPGTIKKKKVSKAVRKLHGRKNCKSKINRTELGMLNLKVNKFQFCTTTQIDQLSSLIQLCSTRLNVALWSCGTKNTFFPLPEGECIYCNFPFAFFFSDTERKCGKSSQTRRGTYGPWRNSVSSLTHVQGRLCALHICSWLFTREWLV